MKVIIVDDDRIVCDGLKKVIPWKELNAELVGIASNGRDALEIAAVEHPDLIISDIKMPIMNGLELCENIHLTMADAYIILLSAHDEFEYARTAMKFGVKDFIVKPIDREKISQLIAIMKNISEKTDNKKSFYATYYNAELEKSFIESLKSNDQAYFMNYFEVFLPSLGLSTADTKELCMKQANILYDYFQEFGIPLNEQCLSKESVLVAFHHKKTKKDIEGYAYKLFLDVMELTSAKKNARIDSTIDYVKRYIYKHYADANLSVSSIANHLQLSPSYLSAIFSQYASENIKSLISNYRIKRACELMEDPALKLTDICDAIGFDDPHYFSKVFKKNVGITPTEYRNLKRGESGPERQ